MLIPIRCFSCGKPIANKWEHYQNELQKAHNKNDNQPINVTNKDKTIPQTVESRVLDEMGMDRYCCRRMFLSCVDLCDKI